MIIQFFIMKKLKNETFSQKQKRAPKILRVLEETYPNVKIALKYEPEKKSIHKRPQRKGEREHEHDRARNVRNTQERLNKISEEIVGSEEKKEEYRKDDDERGRKEIDEKRFSRHPRRIIAAHKKQNQALRNDGKSE